MKYDTKKLLPLLSTLALFALLATPLAAEPPGAASCAATPGAASPHGEGSLDQILIGPIGPIGEQCGDVVCTKGTVCCNPTCNLCLPPDMSCTQEVCNSTETLAEPELLADPIGPTDPEPCGEVFCGPGTYCCNPLCSACVAFGEFCTLGSCPPTS